MTKAKRKVYVSPSSLGRATLTLSLQPYGDHDLITMLIGGCAYTIIMLDRWAKVPARMIRAVRGHASRCVTASAHVLGFVCIVARNFHTPHHPCALHSSVCARLLAVPTANLTLSPPVDPRFAPSPVVRTLATGVCISLASRTFVCTIFAHISSCLGLGIHLHPSSLVSRSVLCLSPFRPKSIFLSYHLCYSYSIQACIGGTTQASPKDQNACARTRTTSAVLPVCA